MVLEKLDYLLYTLRRKEEGMKVYAHRGASGTYPENTLAAFKEAARLPIDGVEFDVHLTKDRKLVVIHDESIDRTSNGTGFVKDMTLDELKQYDFGNWFSEEFKDERIPTLEEVLKVFLKTPLHINIELKSDIFEYEELEEHVLALILSLKLEKRVVISSFNHEAIRKVKTLKPKIETALLFMETLVDPLAYMRNVPADALHLFLPAAVRPFAKQVIEEGCTVRVFTVNEKEHIDALKEVGVHAIFTDYPEEIAAYLNE